MWAATAVVGKVMALAVDMVTFVPKGLEAAQFGFEEVAQASG